MKLLMIKIAENKTPHNYIRNAFNKQSNYIYNTLGKNKEIYFNVYQETKFDSTLLNTVFIIHNNKNIEKIYLCKSQPLTQNFNMLCQDLSLVDKKRKTILNEFIDTFAIDLEKDFKPNFYISHKDVPETDFLHLLDKIYPPYQVKKLSFEKQKNIYHKIEKIKTEYNNLHILAQRSEYCIRSIAAQEIDPNRTEFQRDRERIVHTKSYRRLVDKAQIFTSNKGDHYRTRMTHTLEVSQIARGISLMLQLNPDLTEAIALAHDIGHTPFGHQGERTLDAILTGEIPLIPDVEIMEIGGFKHNYQSLRVLTCLEEKYLEHEGIDLSYQTLEGVLKHTKHRKKNGNKELINYCNIEEFLINGDYDNLYLDKDYPTTLEGQVVKIADEIAQRGHDLDDAFASGLLTLTSFEDACMANGMKPIQEKIQNIRKNIKAYETKRRIIIDKTDMIRATLVPKILGYFIRDVVKHSEENINNYINNGNMFDENNRILENIISFSDEGKLIVDYLEKIISRNVLNSCEVSRFDTKAELIIKDLFKAYYKNPKLLPDNILQRYKKEVQKISTNFIDFRLDDPKLVAIEIERITGILKYQNKEESQIIVNEEKTVALTDEYKNKRKILARCITDHISGMTDNYALNEYSKLYESFSGIL